MDILVQKPVVFRHSHGECYEPPPSGYYTPYNTPPYIATATAGQQHSWLGEPMPYLNRFPTPPITPESALSPRTQSVIMKCSSSGSSSNSSSSGSVAGSTSASPTESYSEHCSSSSSSSGGDCDFLCNWQDCGRVFESLEALAQHVTLRHAIASLLDGLYYCRWGGCQRSERGFNARYKMLVHVRTHTKEKPHRCHLCEKSFSRAENLKIHIRSHSGEKPYKCHFEGCQKAYSNSSDRFKHTRTHSMEKPYMCKVPGCHKRYTDPSSLRKHVKTFKHSIQLIASQSSTLMLHGVNELPMATSANVHVPCLPMPAEAAAAAASSRYFLELPEGESLASDYSLRGKQPDAMEYLPADYWTQSYRYQHTLHGEEFPIDMELDTHAPLDLRVHRT
ncbi:hypothetical protein KR222_001167 [Zaprionus bogoriensis]|nr:hypothetical protein KR222_001167 [Zaprionus bogoriensis]